MLAAAAFFSSFVLLGAFFGFRWWEEKRGVRLFQDSRAVVDTRVAHVYEAIVRGEIPSSWRQSFAAWLHVLTHRVVVLLVEALRTIERPLTRLSYRMRMQKPSSNGKEVSPYLKSIVPEKKAGSDGTTPERGV